MSQHLILENTKEKKIKEILKKHPEYYNWIIKGKFSNDTKEKIKKIKNNQ